METPTLLPATQPWDQPQAFSRLHVNITVDGMSVFSRARISPLHPPRCDPRDSRLSRIKSCLLITVVVDINPSLLRTSHGPCWKLPAKTLPVGPTYCVFFFFSTDKPGSSQTAFWECARVQGDIPTFMMDWRKRRTERSAHVWLQGPAASNLIRPF